MNLSQYLFVEGYFLIPQIRHNYIERMTRLSYI